jgi:imidazolonepropionase-like amidohydrolase
MLKHALVALALAFSVLAAEPKQAYAPDRRAGEGEGPFKRLIIRGATVIDGSGAPPMGPVDLVIEGNRIAGVHGVGFPKVPIDPEGRPKDATREIDGSKMYVLPGFVDMHGHPGGVEQGTNAEYVFKLWLAHGVTTVRDPGAGNGIDWTIHERDRSAKNEIVAPRIVPYVFTGAWSWDGGRINTPEQARKFVQWVAKKGGAGLKVIGGGGDAVYDPDVLAALIEEAHKHKLGTTTHLSQMGVARMNVLQAARLGLDGMEHWYGLPESLFVDRTTRTIRRGTTTATSSIASVRRGGSGGRLRRPAARNGTRCWMNCSRSDSRSIRPSRSTRPAAI